MHPKVSVCVITYNHGEWLRECLQSIVDQVTNFDYEVIVGDDCSTDKSSRHILIEFSERYPKKIIPLMREKNLGGGGTENWLDVMRRARGQYIAHIDGDDRMLPNKLQRQVDFLDAHDECSVVTHDLRVFDSVSGNLISESFSTKSLPLVANINYLLLNGCYFGHSSKMFRRSAIITSTSELPVVDFYMHIEHAISGHIGYINHPLGEYRRSITSKTGTADSSLAFVEAYERAFERATTLHCETSVVMKGRMNFRFGLACDLLRANSHEAFARLIAIKRTEWRYTTYKHKVLSALRLFPSVCSLIARVQDVYNKRMKFNPRSSKKYEARA
jgi:glycosyltransferase involved in cell wall biosynthesis